MPRKTTKKPKEVTALQHDDAKRKNIPTAEYQSVLQKEAAEASLLAGEPRPDRSNG